MFKYTPLAMALPALLCGCASVISPAASNTQLIQVSTVPAGASCTLSNEVGNWQIPSTPGSVTVTKGNPAWVKVPLVVDCRKGLLVAHDTFQPWPVGLGILNGAFGGSAFAVDGARAVAYHNPISLTLLPAQ